MFKYKCFQKKLGSLNVLEYKGDPLSPTIILFHGYGGNSSSFSFFPSQINLRDIVPNWIFPEGPYNANLSSFDSGKAWFPLRISALQEAISSNNPENTIAAFPLDISSSISSINNMLMELDINPDKLILGGFSQGAILSTEVFLTSKLNYSSLVIMAGTLINQSTWDLAARKKYGFPFLQTHGKHDNILPWSLAKKLETLLLNNGLIGYLDSFEGGHEIPKTLFANMEQLIIKITD